MIYPFSTFIAKHRISEVHAECAHPTNSVDEPVSWAVPEIGKRFDFHKFPGRFPCFYCMRLLVAIGFSGWQVLFYGVPLTTQRAKSIFKVGNRISRWNPSQLVCRKTPCKEKKKECHHCWYQDSVSEPRFLEHYPIDPHWLGMTSCSAEIVFLIGVRVWALLPRVGKCNLLLFDTKFRFIRRILCQACNRNGCRTDEDKEGRRTNRTMATLMELGEYK